MDSLEKRRNTYEKLNYYDLITLCIKRKDKIDELKKENERLNLELSGYREAILRDDKLLGLKSRIDKAIEYITSEETINMFSSINAREKWLKINHKILNILQGEDK